MTYPDYYVEFYDVDNFYCFEHFVIDFEASEVVQKTWSLSQ